MSMQNLLKTIHQRERDIENKGEQKAMKTTFKKDWYNETIILLNMENANAINLFMGIVLIVKKIKIANKMNYFIWTMSGIKHM